MKDIFKTSGATYKFPIECDDGYTLSKKKDNDLSLEFKEEKIGLKEIFGVEKFSHWEPDINDIKQDSTGDCYLLAALQSLCKNKNGKKAIRSCFVNGETIESNNFVEIRLYKLKHTEQKNKRDMKELKNCILESALQSSVSITVFPLAICSLKASQ